MAYQQTAVPLTDKDGNTVNVLTATGDGIDAAGKAVVKVDPSIGSITDEPITDPYATGTLQAVIRGVLQLTKTFDTRMTSITREKAILQVGGGNVHSVISTSAITGPAVRIHSVSGVSYGLTDSMGNVGEAAPVYLLLVAPVNDSTPLVDVASMSGLNIHSSANTTNYRIFAPPILLRGTAPTTGTITTDALDQFEVKTIGAEYFGLNGMLAPFGFTFIASSTIEKFTAPVNYNFFAQCQITGV
jgi:hypothetical protein